MDGSVAKPLAVDVAGEGERVVQELEVCEVALCVGVGLEEGAGLCGLYAAGLAVVVLVEEESLFTGQHVGTTMSKEE